MDPRPREDDGRGGDLTFVTPSVEGVAKSVKALNHKEHKGHKGKEKLFFVLFVRFVVPFFSGPNIATTSVTVKTMIIVR